MTVEEIKDEIKAKIAEREGCKMSGYHDGEKDAYQDCLELLENVTL
jgi:hypothetical protein